MPTVRSGDQRHGLGPALLGRHADLDHDLLLRTKATTMNEDTERRKAGQEGAETETVVWSSQLVGYLHVVLLNADRQVYALLQSRGEEGQGKRTAASLRPAGLADDWVATLIAVACRWT